MKDVQLVASLLVGLFLGYLVGINKDTDPSVLLPTNYDPNRALCIDALKTQTQATESCWKNVVTLLGERQQAPEPKKADP